MESQMEKIRTAANKLLRECNDRDAARHEAVQRMYKGQTNDDRQFWMLVASFLSEG